MPSLCFVGTVLGIVVTFCMACGHDELVVSLASHGTLQVQTDLEQAQLTETLKAVTISPSGSITQSPIDATVIEEHFAPLVPFVPQTTEETLYFRAGVHLTEASLDRVYRLTTELLQRPQAHLVLTGYADTTGSRHNNDRLAHYRAQAVARLLTINGVQNSLVLAHAIGDASMQSRRVEIVIREPGATPMQKGKE